MSQQGPFRLISFNLCPFVQRSAITLLYKGVPFERENIDLSNKPDWFLKLSPLGKVPVLTLSEDRVLFESAVINEYLDEVTEGSLLPSDSFKKAEMRAHIEFSSDLLMKQYGLMTAQTQEDFESKRESVFLGIVRLNEFLAGGEFFNGKNFSLADAALAPFLIRLDIINRALKLTDTEQYPKKVLELSKSLLSKEYVQKSADKLEETVFDFFKSNNSYIGSQL